MKQKTSINGWTIDNNYYNPETAKGDTYSKRFGKGRVYVQNYGHYTYSCSFGANSDNSYTGSFYGYPDMDLTKVLRILDLYVPARLRKDRISMEQCVNQVLNK